MDQQALREHRETRQGACKSLVEKTSSLQKVQGALHTLCTAATEGAALRGTLACAPCALQ